MGLDTQVRALADADEDARATLERVVPLVYRDLHRLAHHHLAHEAPDHLLQTTALVHETYLRLSDVREATWRNRAEFLAVASTAMRRILINHAVARKRKKRGGEFTRITLEDAAQLRTEPAAECLAVDSALDRLLSIDPRKAKLVELRYFAGLQLNEACAVLGISLATGKRDWVSARAWILRELVAEDDADGS